ncbi:hypothetical protein OUZ56_010573 [Daphnia magna]|uniref:CCHC-type domain-containing protein n=1 Tax=Daphnia magna TaxID=35525 RepID=A0ABR0AIX7_9CRUS|nr:hypothetical protein OUZ56_010573 [Daphnia magna]
MVKACDIVRSCEVSRAQLSQISADLTIRRPDESVNRLSEKYTRKGVAGGGTQPSSGNSGGTGQSFVDCAVCGRRHIVGRCSAANIMCYACGQNGHYARRRPNPQPRQQSSSSRAPPALSASGPHGRPDQRGTSMQLHLVEGEPENRESVWALEVYVTHKL